MILAYTKKAALQEKKSMPLMWAIFQNEIPEIGAA